ncbi:HEATR2 family protein [Megaselia abdita]
MDVNDICEKLQSEERYDVRNALSKLMDFLKERPPQEKVKEVYENIYLYLLKCYGNRFENIRENAVLVVTEFFDLLPRNDFYLESVISTLASRIGKKEIIESSEEMRLLLVQQLHGLIQKFKMEENSELDLLSSSVPEITAILLKTLTDPYPAVSKEVCFCIVSFSQGTKGIYQVANKFPPPLFKLIHHKHSHNRVAATKALGQVAMFILSNNHDCLLRIFHEMSPLLMDSMPLVRLECGLVGCKMLLNHRDRYSYFERMIPLVLCCLKDDSPEIPKTIEKLWKECGQLYFEENEAELSKTEIADFVPKNYPPNVIRPTLGCRAIVQRCLRIIPLIMRESSDWKDNVRLHSLKLFYQFVLHAEKSLTAKFFEFLPDLAKSCSDDEKEIREEAVKVCNLLGHLLTFEDWIEHGIDALEKNCKLGYIICFHEMYKTAKTEATQYNHALEVSKIISQDDFCHKTNTKIQNVLLNLASNTLNKSNSIEEKFQSLSLDSSNISFNIYKATIKVMSLSFDYEDRALQNQGNEILECLKNEKTIPQLHSEYLGPILMDLLPLLETPGLDMGTEPILLLNGFIRICNFQENYLRALTKCIKKVWEFSSSDAKVKIFTSIASAMMNWDKTMGVGQNSKLEKFLNKCVSNHLVWKAGSSAESTRTLAVTTLCAVVQGAQSVSREILPKFANYFPSLIEENCIATRLYSLKCFVNFGPVDMELLKPIAYGKCFVLYSLVV